jgi:hypothetical protein
MTRIQLASVPRNRVQSVLVKPHQHLSHSSSSLNYNNKVQVHHALVTALALLMEHAASHTTMFVVSVMQMLLVRVCANT